MKRTIITSLAFLGGIGLGFCVGTYTTDKRLRTMMDEEVKAVEEYYEKKLNEESKQVVVETIPVKPSDDQLKEVVDDILEKHSYTNYSKLQEEADNELIEIEIISPEEYGEDLEYDCVEGLTYYSDGYLADEYDEVVENITELIGSEALYSFGQYEDDAVHVKNNELKKYYQIIKSDEKYSNIVWENKIHIND